MIIGLEHQTVGLLLTNDNGHARTANVLLRTSKDKAKLGDINGTRENGRREITDKGHVGEGLGDEVQLDTYSKWTLPVRHPSLFLNLFVSVSLGVPSTVSLAQ